MCILLECSLLKTSPQQNGIADAEKVLADLNGGFEGAPAGGVGRGGSRKSFVQGPLRTSEAELSGEAV